MSGKQSRTPPSPEGTCSERPPLRVAVPTRPKPREDPGASPSLADPSRPAPSRPQQPASRDQVSLTPQPPGASAAVPRRSQREEELDALLQEAAHLRVGMPQDVSNRITQTDMVDRQRIMQAVAARIKAWLSCLAAVSGKPAAMLQVNGDLNHGNDYPSNLLTSLVSASLACSLRAHLQVTREQQAELKKLDVTPTGLKRGVPLVYFAEEKALCFGPYLMARSLLMQLLRYANALSPKRLSEVDIPVKEMEKDLDESYVGEDGNGRLVLTLFCAIRDLVEILPDNSDVYIVVDRPERMDLRREPYSTHYQMAFQALCSLADSSRFVPSNGATIKLLFVCAWKSHIFDRQNLVDRENIVNMKLSSCSK